MLFFAERKVIPLGSKKLGVNAAKIRGSADETGG
jgi:hypothetical protein